MDEAPPAAKSPLPAMNSGCRRWQPILKPAADAARRPGANGERAVEAVPGGGEALPSGERDRP